MAERPSWLSKIALALASLLLVAGACELALRVRAMRNEARIRAALEEGKPSGAPDFEGPWLSIDWTQEDRQRRKELQLELAVTQEELNLGRQEALRSFSRWRRETARDLASAAGAELPANVRAALATPASEVDEKQLAELQAYYLEQQPEVRRAREVKATLRWNLLKRKRALVMVEDTPRESFVLERGNFLDPGEIVQPGTPAALHAMPGEGPFNRLNLAEWLVSPENPLVARVMVNRAWLEFFGRGIVTTPEDYGTRGRPPTHPLLLDWLAVDFMANGWSMKRLHKQIAMSATYRQSSRVRPEVFERDPLNELYARGPRFRLGAEFVRDNALAVSGLLARKLHGPPAYFRQPEGFWRMIGVGATNKYRPSVGEDRYRRGVYSVWRRSSPYPSFTNFDAPDRSTSCLRRRRTNTPLQALNLLNDPVFVEAAVALAYRIQTTRGVGGVPERARFGFRLVLAREPSLRELTRLEALYRDELARLEANPEDARALLEDWTERSSDRPIELAAWFFVAHVLLNLDETITKG